MNEIRRGPKLHPAEPLSKMPWSSSLQEGEDLRITPLTEPREGQPMQEGDEPKPKYDQGTVTRSTMVSTMVGVIQFKDAVPHMVRLVKFWWRGPFKPRQRVYWEMLWGLDLFAGRIPVVKTMIALNVLFWIWIAVR